MVKGDVEALRGILNEDAGEVSRKDEFVSGRPLSPDRVMALTLTASSVRETLLCTSLLIGDIWRSCVRCLMLAQII